MTIKQYTPTYTNEDLIINICEAINDGTPRGEMLDNLDTIEEVFFDIYEKINNAKMKVERDNEYERKRIEQAELDKWTEYSLKDCPDYDTFLAWAQDKLHFVVVEDTPHGECGTDEEVGYFRWNDKEWEVTYSPDWDRHDKQYYYIDDYGDNISAVEIV